MLVAPFIGSMYLSMDTTAGERERKSLEPLLSLPVSRSAITLGKFAAATLFAVAACLLTTATIVLTISQVPLELLGVRVQLTPAALSRLVVCTLPLCPLAAALQLAIASVTKSIKEAQTWTSITLFMPMVPGMILTMRPVNPESWMNVVPILSQQLLARASLSGEPLPMASK